MTRPRLWSCVLGLTLLVSLAQAKESFTLEQILAHKETPAGVVIEILTGDNKCLSWALPKAERVITTLRERFPDLPVAVVSHGREQFALQKSKQDEQKQVHQEVKTLIAGKVAVHVCGTYASRRGLSEEDFPDYVNVAAAGPAQINDYVAVGYLLLVITKPD